MSALNWNMRNVIKVFFFYLESLKCFNVNYIAQGHFVMLLVLYARLNQTKQLQNINQLLNPFPNDKFLTLPNWKSLQTTILKLMKMAESPPNG